MIHIPLFFLLAVLLYFVSRKTIHSCFFFFSRFLKHPQAAFRMMALLYFPGTLIHEMSHMVMAMMLNLKVRDISLIPKVRGSTLKLGTVWYEKKDVVRGLMVGIAPFFAAMFVFWFIDTWRLLYMNMMIGALVSYIVFAVSSTMFSSKQDLVDLVYVIPIVLVLVALGYIFRANVVPVIAYIDITGLENFFAIVNSYLIFSLILNSGIIVVLSIILKLFR